MAIPNDIKENVRAVLLSKTDGSGILVSTFLKDYKSIIHKQLMYKDLGYQTLEKFIKDLPDVCRLEYSDQHMAFKLFGIAKPNTYVSSFVKRAEGNEDSDSSRKSSSNKGEKIKPTNDLNEKWEPSSRGLYSLCFPNQKGNGLETKEAVAMKFAQLGEVVEINVIPSLTFIRYRDEKAAKKAIELYSSELRLRRAEERLPKSGGHKDRRNNGDSGGAYKGGSETNSTRSGGNKWGRKEPDFNDDDWDDDHVVQKSSPGGYGGNSHKSNSHEYGHSSDDENKRYNNSRETHNSGGGDSYRRNDDRPRGTRGSKQGAGDGQYPRQDDSASRSDHQMSPIQVYIGNWPNDANESDLKSLISPYNCIGCRIKQSKESNMKKFAFVDLPDEREAQRIINDLNNTMYRNRDLRCRLGKKAKGDNPPPHTQDDTHKGGIEKQFEKLTVHKSQPRHENNMPHLDTPSSPHMRHDNSMPPLETPASPYSHMPPLEDLPNDMPPLEKVLSPAMPSLERHPTHEGMPNLEEISPIKHMNGVAESSTYNPVQLNVGNFPYGTSENELMMMLGPFGAQKITIMNKDMTSRSTYAFADFCDATQAVVAMENLDQSFFKGRKLVVTLTNPAAAFHQQNVSHVPNLTCTVTGNSDRTVAIQDYSQMSPASRGLNSEIAFERSLKPNRSNFNFQRLTTTLQDYTRIATKLRAEEQFQSVAGMKMTVMITHVENEKFFWGQILEDSVNGVNQDLHRLEALASQLQLEPKTTPVNGLGRCIAKFENEWFRAWCTFETERNGQEVGELIFIDYGNKTFTSKAEMFKAKPMFWTLPPMAKPFKLVDVKYDLDTCVNRVAKLDVVDPGTTRTDNQTNSVTTVHAQWF